MTLASTTGCASACCQARRAHDILLTCRLMHFAASYCVTGLQLRDCDWPCVKYGAQLTGAVAFNHVKQGGWMQGSFWPYKKEAQKQFNDFWEVPKNDSRRSRPGVYSSDIVVCVSAGNP